MTERLASAAARHPGRTVGAWIAAVLAAAAFTVLFLGDALSGEAELLNDPESYQASDLIDERLPRDLEATTDVVLVRSRSVRLGDPEFQRKIDEVTQRLRNAPGVFYVGDEPEATTPAAAIIGVGLEDEAAADSALEAARAADDERFDLYVTGNWSADRDFQELSQEDLEKGELQFGLPVALIVLLLVFGAVVAGLVPLALAVV